jgi:hypothetical protein
VSVGRLAASVEATAYFVVAEALTNVAKHAQADRAAVVARLVEGQLCVEVRDDGAWGARPRRQRSCRAYGPPCTRASRPPFPLWRSRSGSRSCARRYAVGVGASPGRTRASSLRDLMLCLEKTL